MKVFRGVMIVAGAIVFLRADGLLAAFGQGAAVPNKAATPATTVRARSQQAVDSVNARFPETKRRAIYAEITRADADAKAEAAGGAAAHPTSKGGAKPSTGGQYATFEKMDKDKRAAIGAKYKLSEAEVKAIWMLGRQGDWPSGAATKR